MAREAGQGSETGVGTRKSYEPEHAGRSSAVGEKSFFGEFFGGVPFDAPCTLGDLLKSDEPPSPGTAAANERWLQMPHPEHFFKETDGFVAEKKRHSHPPSWSSPTATMNRTYDREGSDARDTKMQTRDRMRSNATALPGRDGKENRNGKVPVKEKNRCQILRNKLAVTATARGSVEGGRDNKRRRATSSVSTVNTRRSSSSASRADATGRARITGQAPKDQKDPMKKKLEEYKRSAKPALSARRTAGKISGEGCSELKTSAAAVHGLRSVTARKATSTSGTVTGVSRVGTRTVAANRPAVDRRVSSVRGDSSQKVSKKESSVMTVPESAPPAMEMVTRSVKTVKRRVGGGIAGRGYGRDRANAGAPGTGGTTRGVAGGPLKKIRRGPIGGDTRRMGPTSGGVRGRTGVGVNEPALVLDAELEARLAEHNKGVARGKHTYEPKRSLRDSRMWEVKTGKVYRSLTVDQRVDANKEIDAMRAAMRHGTLGGH